MARPSRFAGALVACVCVLASSRARGDSGAVWGITTEEVLLPPEIVLILHEPGTQSNASGGQKAVYIGTVLVGTAIPATVGLVAELQNWDTTVPRAAHLGLWSGLSGLMVGSALSARHDEPLLIAPSPIPWILGGVGGVLGATFGATQVNRGSPRETGLMATGAMVAVACVPALIDVVINGAFVDDVTLTRHARRDLAIGMGVGLAAGYTTMLLLPNTSGKAPPANVSAAPIRGGALVTLSGAL